MTAGTRCSRSTRSSAGARSHRPLIDRDGGGPEHVVIVNEFATLDGARAFSQDPSLPGAMERSGVDGPPQVWIVDEAEARRY